MVRDEPFRANLGESVGTFWRGAIKHWAIFEVNNFASSVIMIPIEETSRVVI